MNTTSASLLDCLAERADHRSWQQFTDLYQPWLRGQLRGHGLQAADVEDLTQEILAVVMKEVPHFQHSGRKGAFRAWLRGVTVNRLREFWRERKGTPADGSAFVAALDQLADEHSELSLRWDREHNEHVVGQLLKMIAVDFEPKTWQAFQAFVIQGRKAAEVAAEIGISEGAVWTAKSHVLKRLRQIGKGLLD